MKLPESSGTIGCFSSPRSDRRLLPDHCCSASERVFTGEHVYIPWALIGSPVLGEPTRGRGFIVM